MRKLDILLVKPYQEANEVQPPLGLGYIASTVKKGHNIVILDCIKEGMDLKKFREHIRGKKFDIVGFQCYTVDLNTVKGYSKEVRKAIPGSVVIAGGPQPTLDPSGTLDYLHDVDYVFVGEAEISFPKFAAAVASKRLSVPALRKIPGIAFSRGGKYIQTERVFTENLDDYDPSWELFGISDYPNAPHGAFYKQSPTAPLIITRGCPFQCTYCGGPLILGRRIRSHSVDYVIGQMEMLHRKYGIMEFFIEDDNFTMKRGFIKEFCEKLIEKDLGITWTCPNGIRLDTLDKGLLALMKRSGLYSVSVGIESGSDRIRKLMNKNLTTSMIREKVELIHEAGLGIIGFFIVGFPGETKSDIEKSIKFACDLPLKRVTFSAFKPFPGTPIYKELVEEGRIKEVEFENFSLDRIVWSPEGISMEELKGLRRKAFLRFYLRPKILFQMVREIRSFENLKFILIRIYRWLS